MLLDLPNLPTVGSGQSVQVRKVIERHGGHPARLREAALIDRAQNSGIIASQQLSCHADELVSVFRIKRVYVSLRQGVHDGKMLIYSQRFALRTLSLQSSS